MFQNNNRPYARKMKMAKFDMKKIGPKKLPGKPEGQT
jgi:hypothetical protein